MGHFWGYRTDEKNWEFLKRLTAEINRLTLVPLPAHPHPDLVCLAPFADSDKESYFRAQILYVSGNSAEVCFSVINLSTGNEADSQQLRQQLKAFGLFKWKVNIKWLQLEKWSSRNIPCLSDLRIRPVPGSPEEQGWLGWPSPGYWPGPR